MATQPQQPQQQPQAQDVSRRAAVTPAQVEQYTIERNITSLIAIPQQQCPWPFVRHQLLQWALAGDDIYAYKPLMSRTLVIFHRQPDPMATCRFTPKEWGQRFGYLSADGVDVSDQEGGVA